MSPSGSIRRARCDAEGDYAQNSRGVAVEDFGGAQINPDYQTNPHSGTGYLSIEYVRKTVRDVAGSGFAQFVARNVIVRDLVRDIENGHPTQRSSTLRSLPRESSTRGREPKRVQQRLRPCLGSRLRGNDH